jgi:tyrosyl-tRNA synthetase
VPRAELAAGLPVVEALRRSGLAASNGEARRLIRGGGARVNDQPVGDENATLGEADLDGDGVIKLSAGRKRHALVKTG